MYAENGRIGQNVRNLGDELPGGSIPPETQGLLLRSICGLLTHLGGAGYTEVRGI